MVKVVISQPLGRGVKLIFTTCHIRLVVAFKGLSVILGMYKCNYSLTVKELKLYSNFHRLTQVILKHMEVEELSALRFSVKQPSSGTVKWDSNQEPSLGPIWWNKTDREIEWNSPLTKCSYLRKWMKQASCENIWRFGYLNEKKSSSYFDTENSQNPALFNVVASLELNILGRLK